ncbi:hypothetical protein [Rariglobus hedericola]|uniref:Copper chaperone PCu(A)C n=1 Tax=Rariglobus hedericola TaxID=2597822 RepID=A0A556QNN9_9BACT|nr:hypothetical protein [Rariglobus hedericola]TSJ78255.1 hypothetical protein FPL22_02815 [Rariglobus hedericola]
MHRPTPLSLFTTGSLAAILFLTGCASSTSSATRKDLNVLQPGTTRAVVIDELGIPATTSTSRAGLQMDVFTFVQGTAASKKAPRPVEPEQAEQTEMLALLEQNGTSPLAALSGKKLTVQVNYDEAGRVKDTVLLRMEK